MNETQAAKWKFAKLLRAAKRHTGDPTLREIVRAIEKGVVVDNRRARQVSTATLSRAMGGESFPKWWVVESMLFGCGADTTTVVYRKVREAWMVAAEIVDPLGVDDDEFTDTPVKDTEKFADTKANDDTSAAPGRLSLVNPPEPQRRFRRPGA